MNATKPTQTNEILLVSVSNHGVKFAVNGENKTVSWRDLNDASAGPQYGVYGVASGNADEELRSLYASLRQQAVAALRNLPRNEQGLVVRVHSRTGGATWVAEVYDAAGEYRRDLMHAGEGCDEPRRWLAEKAADEIARRIGASVKVSPVV